MTSKLVASICLVAFVGGCAAAPRLPAPASPGHATDYASSASFAIPPGPDLSQTWWTAYGDAQLDAWMSYALAHAPTLAEAQARLRLAQADSQVALAADRLQLGLDSAAGEVKQSYRSGFPPAFIPHGYRDFGQIALRLSEDLDAWGKTRETQAAVFDRVKAARLDAINARLVLTTAIVCAYADFEAISGDIEAAEARLRNRAQTSALIRQRVADGRAHPGESAQARANVLSAWQAVSALTQESDSIRRRLSVLAGRGPDDSLTLVRPKPAMLGEVSLPADLAAHLEALRPDLAASAARVRAARHRELAARAALRPGLVLSGEIGASALGLGALTNPGAEVGRMAVQVAAPILDGGRLRAGVSSARAGYDLSVAAYDRALVEALGDVANAVRLRQSLDAQMSDAGAAVEATEAADRIAQLRARGGLTSLIERLATEDALIGARQRLSRIHAERLAADARLAFELGGGALP